MAITKVGDSQIFQYTGGIQQFVVPMGGIYQLDVWGAKGGGSSGIGGGEGGHSSGYVKLKKGETLFIVCGGCPGDSKSAGFNGGGTGNALVDYSMGGGGATHIAKANGTLAQIGYATFVSHGLIVAGGGGGARDYYGYQGGKGGGASGTSSPIASQSGGQGGGQGGGGYVGGSFGQGGNAKDYGSAGGGGFFGGGASYDSGGGGGSGWIGGVPQIVFKGVTYTPLTQVGVNSGNGYAKITLVEKVFPEIDFNGTILEAMDFNGTEVEVVEFNGVILE